jgi:hypothetical protein
MIYHTRGGHANNYITDMVYERLWYDINRTINEIDYRPVWKGKKKDSSKFEDGCFPLPHKDTKDNIRSDCLLTMLTGDEGQ